MKYKRSGIVSSVIVATLIFIATVSAATSSTTLSNKQKMAEGSLIAQGDAQI